MASTFRFLLALGFGAAIPGDAQHHFFAAGGVIPDSPYQECLPGADLLVDFEVSGLPSGKYAAQVSFDLQHLAAGELTAELFLPTEFGAPVDLFMRVGGTNVFGCAGSTSDFNGNYSFDDWGGGAHLWTAAAENVVVPPGRYRPSRQPVDTIGTPPSESMLSINLFTTPGPNGTWTLRFNDHVPGTIGLVANPVLVLTPLDHFAVSGTNLGAIADGGNPCPSPGASRFVTFPVVGAHGNLAAVAVDATLAHTWVGDLDVRLIEPGSLEQWLFSRVGAVTASCFGFSSDLAGAYTFRDGEMEFKEDHLWDAAQSSPVPSGAYRTTEPGGASAFWPDITDLTSTYVLGGVDEPNGTWTLRLRDMNLFETGSISAATLNVYAMPWLFADGFERGSTSAWSAAEP